MVGISRMTSDCKVDSVAKIVGISTSVGSMLGNPYSPSLFFCVGNRHQAASNALPLISVPFGTFSMMTVSSESTLFIGFCTT